MSRAIAFIIWTTCIRNDIHFNVSSSSKSYVHCDELLLLSFGLSEIMFSSLSRAIAFIIYTIRNNVQFNVTRYCFYHLYYQKNVQFNVTSYCFYHLYYQK